MQVSDTTLVRLEHLGGQLDRTAYLLDDASAQLRAVDFRTRSWRRDANQALEATRQAWDAAQEFNAWSRADATEIEDFGIRKAAEAAVDRGTSTAGRYMNGALSLADTFGYDTDRVTARHMVDTMARLSTVSGSAIRDAGMGILELGNAVDA